MYRPSMEMYDRDVPKMDQAILDGLHLRLEKQWDHPIGELYLPPFYESDSDLDDSDFDTESDDLDFDDVEYHSLQYGTLEHHAPQYGAPEHHVPQYGTPEYDSDMLDLYRTQRDLCRYYLPENATTSPFAVGISEPGTTILSFGVFRYLFTMELHLQRFIDILEAWIDYDK